MANPEFMQFRTTFHARGFGLIELMIAMTIGLILLGGIGYVFLGSKQTFRTLDDFSRIQENVRFALETVGVDVRMAGYSGCVNLAAINPANPTGIPVNIVANAPPAVLLGEALRGYASVTWTAPGTAPANWVSNTGVIHISRATAQGVKLTGNMGTDNANIQIAGNPTGIVAEQALLISDCESADVFRAQNVSASGGTVTIAHTNGTCNTLTPAQPCNTDNRLSKAYGADAELYGIVSTTYYIGTNVAGNPALYRRPEGGTAEELVENVQNLMMRFGIDTTNDFVVDDYVEAGSVTDWRQVLTARVSMIFRSNSNNVATQLQPCVVEYTTSCTPSDATDRRLRQVATATFGLRNRLP